MKHLSLLRPFAITMACMASGGVLYPDVVGDYAVGRKDDALKNTLHRHCGPVNMVDTDIQWSEYLEIIAEQQGVSNGSGSVTDAVTGHRYSLSDARMSLALAHPVDKSWFGLPAAYRSQSLADLYNCILTCPEVMKACAAGNGFASVDAASDIVYGDGWSRGVLLLDGWDIPVIEPADAMKGPVARRILYIATIYPCSIWSGDGVKFFTSAEYPGLTDFSIDTYMDWHRQYPVTDIERSGNDAVEARQGNRNPFVDYPELAEYIWGENRGEVYNGQAGKTDPPPATGEQPVVKLPLRGVYSVAEDVYLDLYSPYVPDNVMWSVDGADVENARIALSEIGVGTHEIRYRNAIASGKLFIDIRP
ncbi:endonuclease [Muribaculum intestinale]|uniref:endonuclease n=1 Tax=Muribaculum intestinale TaxID=1796646 RepID=UPI00242D8146|nr:endonuclease [Muribaculum intestinale]